MAQITLNSTGVASSGSLALQSNGTTTAVTIDTSQNVGIGTASPGTVLNVVGTTGIRVRGANSASDGALDLRADNTSCSINAATFGTSVPLVFKTDGTERMRIDSSGNVGIGTSSPLGKVTIRGLSGYNLTLGAVGTDSRIDATNDAGSGSVDFVLSGSSLKFNTSGSERARIDTSGNLLVGQTSAGVLGGSIGTSIEASGLNNARITVNHSSGGSSNGSYFMQFAYGGSLTGSISQSSVTSVAFNTTSDKRLKTDNGLAVDTSVIDNIEVHDFTWTSSGDADRGVFAQDAILVKPSAVTVGSDEVNEDGNIITPWSVDYSKYVPDLIVHAQQLKKQVQEQQALITTLTDRITALEEK